MIEEILFNKNSAEIFDHGCDDIGINVVNAE